MMATLLCPAGHLPLTGGDHVRHLLEPISPLEGEMPGRAEGGMRATKAEGKQLTELPPAPPTFARPADRP
jgi:hypothetical protein